MAKSAQRQYLVKVSGIDGRFSTKSGGNITADVSKQYDGGSLQPDVLSSPAEAENITVGRAYDHGRDAQMLKQLRKQVGSARRTITVTPTDQDMVARNRPTVYPKALLVGITEPEYDSSSGDFATFELEFAIGTWQ